MLLKEWYEHRNYYHMIGFLIACREKTLCEIYEDSAGKTKTDFEKLLIDYIKNAVNVGKENYGNMSYENEKEREKLERLLFLFNVESVRKIEDQYQHFPFDKYKFDEKDRKTKWSLEHIHAQHSKDLKKDQYEEWLANHLKSVKAVLAISEESEKKKLNELIDKMETALKKVEQLSKEEFNSIREDVVKALTDDKDEQYLHSIANLALLAGSDNSSLGNSAFDVKRNAVIKMAGKGRFIPLCTKRVFLKYYTAESENNQIHFWGHTDREDYIKAMNESNERNVGML